MAKYKRVSLDNLIIDPAYQRDLDEKRVARIAEDFNPALLGALEVSHRNGKHAVFDGQHRLAALRAREAKDAPCLVHEGLSVPDEAMLFVKLQTQRKALTPRDRFRARLTAGEEQAHEILECVERHGYKINGGSHATACEIGAVTALDHVYMRGGVDLLDKTFDLLKIWQGEPKSVDSAIIEGMAVAIDRYESHAGWAKIAAAMEQVTAATVLRKGIATLESGGGSGSRFFSVSKEFGKLVGIRGPYKQRVAHAEESRR